MPKISTAISTAYGALLMAISSNSFAHISHSQGALHDAEHSLIWLSLLLPVALYGAWKVHKSLQTKRSETRMKRGG